MLHFFYVAFRIIFSWKYCRNSHIYLQPRFAFSAMNPCFSLVCFHEFRKMQMLFDSSLPINPALVMQTKRSVYFSLNFGLFHWNSPMQCSLLCSSMHLLFLSTEIRPLALSETSENPIRLMRATIPARTDWWEPLSTKCKATRISLSSWTRSPHQICFTQQDGTKSSWPLSHCSYFYQW